VFKDFIKERLDIKYCRELFRMIPKSLREIFKQIFTMRFKEKPPYEQLINAIKTELTKNIQLGPDLQPIIH
jgi:hypothetical protein